MPRIEFWYDFASTYSYLTAMRIEALADASGVKVVWRPFLLGPIFKAQGWATSPFNVYPAKGRYMVRDIERLALERGLPFAMPDPFPAHSLSAARIGMIAQREGWIAPFTRAVFAAQFAAEPADIGDDAVLARLLRDIGQPESRIGDSRAPDVKDALRAQTDSAAALGLFGAPSLRCDDGEMFWGDDRLEQALAWACRQAASA